MRFRLVQELAADGVPVAVACRVLEVSTSGYYEWTSRPASHARRRRRPPGEQIRDVHAASRGHLRGPRGSTPSCGSGAAPRAAASAWRG